MNVLYSSPVLLEITLNHDDPFVVARDVAVTWNRPKNSSLRFVVRKGFTTDLASIPQAFRIFIPQVGLHIQPAVVHDWCYERHQPQLTRAEADELFLEGMKAV